MQIDITLVKYYLTQKINQLNIITIACPLIGRLHKGFFAPRCSSSLKESISIAKHVGIPLTVAQIDSMQPEDIAKASLEHWKQVAFSSNP